MNSDKETNVEEWVIEPGFSPKPIPDPLAEDPPGGAEESPSPSPSPRGDS